MNRIKKTVSALGAAAALALGGLVVTAPAAQAYTWTQKWQNPQDGKYWAYKTCTREEWFNGCTPGWYSAWYHWSLWG